MGEQASKNADYSDGLKALDKKAYDAAIRAFSKAIEVLGHDSADVYLKRGLAFQAKSRHDEAIEDFNTAMDLGVRAPELFAHLAEAYRGKGWWDESIHFWGVALEADARFAEYYYRRGLAYFDKGWYNEAIEHFLAAGNLDDRDGRFPYAAAVALRCRGQEKEAQKYLEHATELGGKLFKTFFEKYPMKPEFDGKETVAKKSAPKKTVAKKATAKKSGTKKVSCKKKPLSKKTASAKSSGPSMIQAALKVLKGAGKPMHYKDITKAAIVQKIIKSAGATPEQSMRSAISREISGKGARARFRRNNKGKGFYSLTRWDA